MQRQYSIFDKLLIELDQGLGTVFGVTLPNRPSPAKDYPENNLSKKEKRNVFGFMRIDHTGEICAQALYRGQMLSSRSASTYQMLEKACEEEKDHLAWTHERLHELNTYRSYCNSYWYIHSLVIGILTGLCGDRWSLGFVEETEKQVCQHLTYHIEHLPIQDIRSRKILEQMREDEQKHSENALKLGGEPLPFVIKLWMSLQSKIMITFAYYI